MKRPTTIEELQQSMSGFSTDQGRNAGLAYSADPTDVFIATYPKCGTTWMQQIVHCLRTGGDMDFGEITEVVPWLEMSHDLGMDNYAPQKASPHCFKSHLSWSEIPKGGRYIHITRNPESTLLSFYHFFEGWFFEVGAIDLDSFADYIVFKGTRSGLYWNHVSEWWPQRCRDDVLFLCYEEMLENPVGLIKSVARFMDINLDTDLLETVLKMSSAEFMLRHVSQFDDHLIRLNRDKACGLPPGGNSNKVGIPVGSRKGTTLSRQTRDKLARAWRKFVAPETGLGSYDELLTEIRNSRAR